MTFRQVAYTFVPTGSLTRKYLLGDKVRVMHVSRTVRTIISMKHNGIEYLYQAAGDPRYWTEDQLELS